MSSSLTASSGGGSSENRLPGKNIRYRLSLYLAVWPEKQWCCLLLHLMGLLFLEERTVYVPSGARKKMITLLLYLNCLLYYRIWPKIYKSGWNGTLYCPTHEPGTRCRLSWSLNMCLAAWPLLTSTVGGATVTVHSAWLTWPPRRRANSAAKSDCDCCKMKAEYYITIYLLFSKGLLWFVTLK